MLKVLIMAPILLRYPRSTGLVCLRKAVSSGERVRDGATRAWTLWLLLRAPFSWKKLSTFT